jgi:4-alpha-glucanotransferase
MQRALRSLRAGTQVDYEQVMALKLPMLQQLYRTFVRTHRTRDSARGRAFRRFCQREGDALLDFSTFQVLQARFGTGDARVARTWHDWPVPYRDRHPAAIERIRRDHRDEIDFHRYLQFELETQLERVARDARAHHLPIGVYQDLAIGSSGEGSDVWAFRDVFVSGVSVGAPPDEYNAAGQNWNFPPLDPRRLRATGYDYFVRVIRANLRTAGALRIDHVMGLLRQYWIPNGATAAGGAYVRFPADDLFGIVALESCRARALVIGEDLGTVPAEIPAMLRRWGVLSTRVLYFERDSRGRFHPARHYPSRALVSANTHDLPPVIGFLEGRDLALRRQLGVLDDQALARARSERAHDVTALVQRLRRAGLLGKQRTPARAAAVRDAIHVFLGRTRAALVGIALDDLAAERDPVNVPGVDVERHPSWSRRLKRTLEAIAADAGLRRSVRRLGRRRWPKTQIVR